MKYSKSIIAIASLFIAGVVFAATTEAKVAGCCTKAKAEVDFVLEHEQQPVPVEVKYGAGRAVGKSFYSFIEKYHPQGGAILTREYVGEEKIKGAAIKFVPLSYF